MLKDARISVSIPASANSPRKSDRDEFVAIVMFSEIGLLSFVVAIIMGEPGVWY